MISVDGLAVEFGGTALFSDISFVINEKDRIALMGKNGAGKSTLLKILAGARQPTRGKVSAPKDCVVAYLPQHLMTEDGRTVFDETAQAFSHLHEMEAQIEKLNKELETRTDYESDSYMALIEEVSSLSEKFYSIDATNYEEDVEKALKSEEMPAMGLMYYNVPDMGIVPPLQEGNNEDYLKRLEKAMDEHGIILQRYQRLSEVVYCL